MIHVAQSSSGGAAVRYRRWPLPVVSVYVTIRCPSVRLSLSRRSIAVATCSWFAAGGRYRLIATARRQRLAAGSVIAAIREKEDRRRLVSSVFRDDKFVHSK